MPRARDHCDPLLICAAVVRLGSQSLCAITFLRAGSSSHMGLHAPRLKPGVDSFVDRGGVLDNASNIDDATVRAPHLMTWTLVAPA